MKYRILHDFGTEGHSFFPDEFNSVADAVIAAIKLNYSTPFLIVQIIEWEAKEKQNDPLP